MTAALALARNGFTWERLEKLARKALHDRMRNRRISLDPERYEEALDWYVEVGARWSLDYRAEKSGGVSFASSCYRRMYPRLTDYLRHRHGDDRRGTPLFTVTVDRFPDVHTEAAESFDDAVAALAANLPARARWTLERLGRPIAEQALTLTEAAARHGITVELAEELLNELGEYLGRKPQLRVETGAHDYAVMEEWVA